MFLSKHHAALKDALHHLEKLIHYERDQMGAGKLETLTNVAKNLKAGLKNRVDEKQCEYLLKAAQDVFERAAPPRRFPALAENLDVILVAVALAVGIRAFFFQPFKIPTNSMFPTLRGVVVEPLKPEEKFPLFPASLFQKVVLGRDRIDFAIPAGSRLMDIRSGGFSFLSRATLKFDTPQGILNVVQWTEASPDDFARLLGEVGWMPGGPAVRVRARASTGDHLFVNKITYNFRKPERGEPFVFRTEGLPTGDAVHRGLMDLTPERRRFMGSQYYIKRCVGVPGDVLSVDPPRLLVNGAEAVEPPIRHVWEAMSTDPRFRGYGNPAGGPYLSRPGESVELKPGHYWAMGDNSYNSADSRAFGQVPTPNLVGNACFIYYPFNRFLHPIR